MKTTLALLLGLVIGLAVATVVDLEAAVTGQPAVAADAQGTAPAPDGIPALNPEPLFETTEGSCAGHGTSCTQDSDCGYCDGYPCKCFVRCTGTCGCP